MSAYERQRFDSPVKVINVRKVASRVLGTSNANPSSDVLAHAGLAEARLMWRNKWMWNNDEHHRGLNNGLRGGPMVSIGLPTSASGRGVTIEARCAALQYALPENRAVPAVPDEQMRDRDTRMSFEGGLYLNLPFGN